MSRTAQRLAAKVAALIVVIVIAGGIAFSLLHHPASAASDVTTTSSHHELTSISYPGVNGVNALVLLKRHATVTTKHYSFGDMVISIDGVVGNGPKYWTLYVNGKEATVGASDLITTSKEKITWKLQ